MADPALTSRSQVFAVPPSSGNVGPWTSYEPLWQAGFADADPGAGYVQGWYRDDTDENGRHVTDVEIKILLSTGFSIPSGVWTLWLPDLGESIVPFADFVGGLTTFSFGGVNNGSGIFYVKSGTREARLFLATGDPVDDSNPVAWTDLDYLVVTVRYGSEFVSCS